MKNLIVLGLLFTTFTSFAEDDGPRTGDDGTEFILMSEENKCSAKLYTNGLGFSCLEIKDTGNNEIIRNICVNSGLGYNDIEQPVNNHTGYQVNNEFKMARNVYFTAWTGGGLNFMPQDYIVLRKVEGEFNVSNEISWIYGDDEELCKGMTIVDTI